MNKSKSLILVVPVFFGIIGAWLISRRHKPNKLFFQKTGIADKLVIDPSPVGRFNELRILIRARLTRDPGIANAVLIEQGMWNPPGQEQFGWSLYWSGGEQAMGLVAMLGNLTSRNLRYVGVDELHEYEVSFWKDGYFEVSIDGIQVAKGKGTSGLQLTPGGPLLFNIWEPAFLIESVQIYLPF